MVAVIDSFVICYGRQAGCFCAADYEHNAIREVRHPIRDRYRISRQGWVVQEMPPIPCCPSFREDCNHNHPVLTPAGVPQMSHNGIVVHNPLGI